jgi:ActR/RegA family two-component response regulator
MRQIEPWRLLVGPIIFGAVATAVLGLGLAACDHLDKPAPRWSNDLVYACSITGVTYVMPSMASSAGIAPLYTPGGQLATCRSQD